MYPEGEYDLAGFAVGVVEKRTRHQRPQHSGRRHCFGLASNGAHSNGYSLVRKIIERDNPDLDAEFDNGKTLREAIIAPTRLYVKPILAALENSRLKAWPILLAAALLKTYLAFCLKIPSHKSMPKRGIA